MQKKACRNCRKRVKKICTEQKSPGYKKWMARGSYCEHYQVKK